MVVNIKDNGWNNKDGDMVYIIGQMVQCMKVNGKII